MHQTTFRIISKSKYQYPKIQFSPQSWKFNAILSVHWRYIQINRSHWHNVAGFGHQYVLPRSRRQPPSDDRRRNTEWKVFEIFLLIFICLKYTKTATQDTDEKNEKKTKQFQPFFRVRTLSRQSVVSESVDCNEPDSCCASQNKCKCVKIHQDHSLRPPSKYTKNDSTDSDKDECNKWQYLPNTVWKQTAEVTKHT